MYLICKGGDQLMRVALSSQFFTYIFANISKILFHAFILHIIFLLRINYFSHFCTYLF